MYIPNKKMSGGLFILLHRVHFVPVTCTQLPRGPKLDCGKVSAISLHPQIVREQLKVKSIPRPEVERSSRHSELGTGITADTIHQDPKNSTHSPLTSAKENDGKLFTQVSRLQLI